MRPDDVERALDALIARVPEPPVDAASTLASGHERIVRRRVVLTGVSVALLATIASAGAIANSHHTTRVESPAPASTTAPGPPTTTTTPPANAGPQFVQIEAVSALEAWKCLDPLQYTNDGGRTWRELTTPANATHDDKGNPPVCTAVAGGNAWSALTTHDPPPTEILRVRRGAANDVLPFPRTSALSQLAELMFFDAGHGWVLIVHGTSELEDLYRTLDGGKTWTLVADNKPVGYGQVFTSATRGWARNSDDVLTSSDGGATWRAVALPTASNIAGFEPQLYDVVAHGRSVVVSKGIYNGDFLQPSFAVSSDDGRTWSQWPGPPIPADASSRFDAPDALHLRLFSGDLLWISDDGGHTWEPRPLLAGASYVESMSFPTADVGWIMGRTDAGRSPIVLRTTDAGRTWTDVTDGAAPRPPSTTPPPGPTRKPIPMRLAFVSPTEGWLCGTPLQFTSDAGRNWKTVNVPAPTTASLGSEYEQPPLCTAAPGAAWLLRGTGNRSRPEIVRIREGGADIDVFPFENLIPGGTVYALTFIDAEVGWALAQSGIGDPVDTVLYATRDGGRSWTLRNAHASISPGPVAFAAEDVGWALGTENRVERTTDGGRTWEAVTIPTPAPVGDFGVNLGPIVLTGNAIVVEGSAPTGSLTRLFFVVSADGGRTWTMRTGRPPNEIVGTTEARAFGVLDADHWQFAASNALYTTADGGQSWKHVADFEEVASISSVAFLTPNIGFVTAVGGSPNTSSSVVLGTTDGGDTWNTIYISVPPEPA
jgi:photosystem II stability/assembly factor-like uncharacterized protein